MKPEQSIAIMKALADPSRLAITNSLLERSQYVEELAQRHALAPSTVSFHLQKLSAAGLVSSRKEQYYVMFEANRAIFDTTLRQIVSVPAAAKELQEARIDEYRSKVIRTFFRDGRLDKLPAQQKKRLIVLEQFALQFEPGRRYTEPEVTTLITPLFDDYCTIRRLLVDEGIIFREGAAYWRKQPEQAEDSLLPPQSRRKEKREQSSDIRHERAEIKKRYKESRPDMGIYQIRNKVNGRIFVESSGNLEGSRMSRMFQLRMGKIVFNNDLQKDLTEYGPENFEFAILAILDTPAPGKTVEQSLTALELEWIVKLQPFGEKGYNSRKKFEREMGRLTGK